MEIYYEELAPEIMEAKKSHDLLSASWRPKKAWGVIQDKSKVWEPGEQMVYIPIWGQEMRCPAGRQEKRGEFLLLPSDLSGLSWIGWCPCSLGRTAYFPESIWILISSGNITGIPRNNGSLGPPVATQVTRKINPHIHVSCCVQSNVFGTRIKHQYSTIPSHTRKRGSSVKLGQSPFWSPPQSQGGYPAVFC